MLAWLLGCTALFAANEAWAIDVANQADWNSAVAAVAAAGAGSTTVINFTSGFTLSSSLAQLQASNTGVIVNITGNGQTINGASAFQGIQVDGANALTVNISNLSVTNTAARGGNGQAGQSGYFSAGLSYGSGGGGGGGLGAGGGLLVGSGANVTLTSVTFTGNTATGGAGGTGGSAQNTASDPVNGGNGGAGGAANNGGASGGGGIGGIGGHAGGLGTAGTIAATFGGGGGGGGGSGSTSTTTYTPNNAGGAGNASGGDAGSGGGGVTNYNTVGGPGADGGYGGSGGAAQGGAIYVATGGTLTILDTPISAAAATGGAAGSGGTGMGANAFSGTVGNIGTATGAGIFLSGVLANIGVSTGNVTYANTIGGTGLNSGGVTTALNKTGAGMLTLSAANTFVGNVNISGGTLSIAGTSNLGDLANAVALSNGGTLGVTATTTLAAARAFSIAGSGGIDVATGTTTTVQGVIADGASAGSLVKSGTGTLILSGANTYSGATSILNGTLQTGANYVLSSASALTVAAGATLDLNGKQQTVASLAGAGNVNLGAGFTFTFGGDNTSTSFTGNFIGTLVAYKEGTGTFSFSGAGPSNGAIQVNGGTLALTGAADFSGAQLALQANTTLDISGANAGISIKGLSGSSSASVHLGSRTLTIQRTDFVSGSNVSGVIDGSGGLTIGQNSNVRLFGVNTYTGPTTLSSASAALDLRNVSAIAASSEVNLAASGAKLEISNAGGNATIQALRGVAGSIVTLHNNNLVIANAASDFAGIIKPDFGAPTGGVILNGGHQTLSGINTYLGATTVNAGTLSVNGSIETSSLTTVNSGGTLGGTGTVGNTAINGGALAPGNSIGTLNINGNLSFTAASSYMVEVSPTSADRTNVTGTATLGGATVNAIFAGGSYVEKQYTIVNATGGIVGTFGSVVNSNLPSGFKSSLGYDATNAYLNLALDFTPTPTPTPTPSPLPVNSGLNGNQSNTANALTNYFNRTGSIPLVFGALNAAGLTQASGEGAVASQQTTFDAMNQFMGVLTDPSLEGRGAGVPSQGALSYGEQDALAYAARPRGPARDALAMAVKAPPAVFMPHWSVWAAGFGGSQATDGNAVAGSNAATSRIYGTAVGADYRISPQTLAGFALAGGGTSFSVNGLGSGRSDLFQAGGFVRHTVGSAYVTAAAAYGWQDITTDRSIAGSQLQGRFSANAWSGRVEIGHRSVAPWLGGVGLTPYAAAKVTAFDLPAYAETVAGGVNPFALAYAAKTATTTRSELGLRGDKSWAMAEGVLTLRGRAAWAHDYNSERNISATFQSLPGSTFIVNGAQPARNAALTSASAEMNFNGGWSVAATFDGEFSDVSRSYAGKGVVRYGW